MPRSVQRSLTLETQPRAEISTSLARSLSALIDTYLNTFDPVLALWALAQRVGRQFTIGATCIFFWYPARFSRRHTIRLIAVIRDRRKKWNGAVGVCVCVRVFVSFQFVHDKYWITFSAIWEIGMLHRWENRLLRSFCFLAWMFFCAPTTSSNGHSYLAGCVLDLWTSLLALGSGRNERKSVSDEVAFFVLINTSYIRSQLVFINNTFLNTRHGRRSS